MGSACRLFDRFHGSSYSRHVGYMRASTTRALPLRNCSAQDEMPAPEFPAER